MMHKQIYDSVGFNMIQYIRWVQICSSIQNMLSSFFVPPPILSAHRCLLVAITCWQPLSINTWLTMNVAQKCSKSQNSQWTFIHVSMGHVPQCGIFNFSSCWALPCFPATVVLSSFCARTRITGRNASDVGQQFGNANAAGNHVCLFGSVW